MHPRGAVAWDAAVERVFPGLELHGERLGTTVKRGRSPDGGAGRACALLDREVVRER